MCEEEKKGKVRGRIKSHHGYTNKTWFGESRPATCAVNRYFDVWTGFLVLLSTFKTLLKEFLDLGFCGGATVVRCSWHGSEFPLCCSHRCNVIRHLFFPLQIPAVHINSLYLFVRQEGEGKQKSRKGFMAAHKWYTNFVTYSSSSNFLCFQTLPLIHHQLSPLWWPVTIQYRRKKKNRED